MPRKWHRFTMHASRLARRSVWVPRLVAVAVILVAGCDSSTQTGSTTTTATPTSPTAAAPVAAVDIPALVRQVEPSVVTVLNQSGVGSGIVYKSDGTKVTNAHVVDGAEQETVAFADGQQVPARVRAADRLSDVAVLQADRTGLTAATFEQALPELGHSPWA